MNAALTRYRVMAYIVGVMLLVLVCVAMPLKYFGGNPEASKIVSPIHGFLYIVYLLAALDLAVKVRWKAGRTILLMLAGAVPFLSFVMERKVTHEVQERFLAEAR